MLVSAPRTPAFVGSRFAAGVAVGEGAGVAAAFFAAEAPDGFTATAAKSAAAETARTGTRRRIILRVHGFRVADRFRQFRNDDEGVPDDQEIGELADGCVAVLVDRDDRLGRPHPDFVL